MGQSLFFPLLTNPYCPPPLLRLFLLPRMPSEIPSINSNQSPTFSKNLLLINPTTLCSLLWSPLASLCYFSNKLPYNPSCMSGLALQLESELLQGKDPKLQFFPQGYLINVRIMLLYPSTTFSWLKFRLHIDCRPMSFIYSACYLLKTYSVLGTVLGSGDATVDETQPLTSQVLHNWSSLIHHPPPARTVHSLAFSLSLTLLMLNPLLVFAPSPLLTIFITPREWRREKKRRKREKRKHKRRKDYQKI